VEVVLLGHEVHELQVRPVLAVAGGGALADQDLEQPPRATRLPVVGRVEQDHEDVVQEPRAAGQPGAVVEAVLERP